MPKARRIIKINIRSISIIRLQKPNIKDIYELSSKMYLSSYYRIQLINPKIHFGGGGHNLPKDRARHFSVSIQSKMAGGQFPPTDVQHKKHNNSLTRRYLIAIPHHQYHSL